MDAIFIFNSQITTHTIPVGIICVSIYLDRDTNRGNDRTIDRCECITINRGPFSFYQPIHTDKNLLPFNGIVSFFFVYAHRRPYNVVHPQRRRSKRKRK